MRIASGMKHSFFYTTYSRERSEASSWSRAATPWEVLVDSSWLGAQSTQDVSDGLGDGLWSDIVSFVIG